jgi:4-alpha-glucanotransferase
MTIHPANTSERKAGILLHPTSLPGRFGIGDLGHHAHQFAEFLAGAGIRLWQVLPLGPTGYGDSPYQCFSAFAGNPLLISLEALLHEGFLTPEELDSPPDFPVEEVDYGWIIHFKISLLRKAWSRFQTRSSPSTKAKFEEFCRENASWLDDYCLFMAAKEAHGGTVWTQWEASIAKRHPQERADWFERLSDDIGAHRFWQYLFFSQWKELWRHCHRLGISLMGDIPIFVAHDSADVWAHPELFSLADDGKPALVAGVPPDYFSATGQLWGNPLYRWEEMALTGYSWWVDRIRATLQLMDVVRLDHFRGFEGCWEVPGGESTAVNGRWVKGPGLFFFEALERELGSLPIVAENLGVITPEVESLREQFGFPGMAVLQFAFGLDPPAPDFLPHNYVRDLVVYTGTHDNDTTLGWWNNSGAGDSTRSAGQVEREREFALKYLNSDGREMNWTLIRAAMASVANLAIVPLQDVLGLGTDSRMNLPGRPGGNWRWRFRSEMLTSAIQQRLKELTSLYQR